MSSAPFLKKNGREKIGFVGVGRSTLGVYQYLKTLGYRDFVFRSREAVTLPAEGLGEIRQGAHYLSDIREDVLFLSPSVKADGGELSKARQRGVILSSDCDLFFREVQGTVYAVTGSDGKSTTTTMLGELLRSGQRNVRVGGNIGVPLSPFLCDNPKDALYAVELSSFQLMNIEPKTKRAVITTLSPNHLDFHGSFESYIEAKRRIYTHTEEPVVNADCPLCFYSLSRKPFAVYSLKKGKKELLSTGAQIVIFKENNDIFLNETRIFSISDMKISGLYNVQNLMCAVALAYGACDLSRVSDFAKSFCGIAHRAQTVAKIGGVTYVDSSIDSSPSRTASTLGAFAQKPIVILGGRGKGVPFDSLVPILTKKAKGVILMGETGAEIYGLLTHSEAFQKSGAFLRQAENMKDAVRIAAMSAKSGDTVLLSPASTSFDAYRNFEERGLDFQKEVNKLT